MKTSLKMATWGRAFKAALLLLLFVIAWGFIGGIIIALGSFLGVLNIFQIIPEPPYFIINTGALGAIVIVMVIGTLVIFLGTWASAFKIASDLAAEEMRKTMPTMVAQPVTTQAAGATTPACPKCGTPLTYVQQYQRWYCPTCREYQ
ncbi:MAG: hypothetical protein ACP5PQ_04140 [Thermoproteota archaeon]